jgi:2-polyprenyl-3-methyl-5-hydroxy-6-metoxy-1,4-benzoquinol methylase
MIDLTQRSLKKELLDGENIPFPHIVQNMKELNKVNTLLGGHNITIQGVKKLIENKTSRKINICEIGCGGGDNLSAINRWNKTKDYHLEFVGIDIKKECIDFARVQYPELNVQWIIKDYADVEFQEKPDIIFTSLFCHHFNNEQLVNMFEWLSFNSRLGFFINDLHRHPIAFYAIKTLTGLFSNSYLVKSDAPLSVARGFTRAELESIVLKAGIKKYSLKWKWAFRYLLVCKKFE